MYTTPEAEQGTFNSAMQWLKKLDEIERAIDLAFASTDYAQQYRVLNVYWSVMVEWMNEKEETFFNTLRKQAYEVNKKISLLKLGKNGKKEILTADLEIYWEWNIQLKKLINKKGLRMPKKDDPKFALK